MEKILNFIKSIYRWLRADGLLHISFSALIMVLFGWIRPLWIPAIIALAIGIGYEIYQKLSKKGFAEWHDVICDAIGVLIGFVLLIINTGL